MQRQPIVLASELIGRPVVSIDRGDDIAQVKQIVFDSAKHALIGFTLNERSFLKGDRKETLPTSAINAIGPDAVMIDSADDLVAPGDGPASLDGTSDSIDVIGLEVMSGSGRRLGEIDDVVIETGDDPEAVGYRIDTGDGHLFVPIDAQSALSAERMTLPAEADEFVRDDFSGFGAAVTDHRDRLGAAR